MSHPSNLQFITHWESRALISFPPIEEHGLDSQGTGGVFIKINWTTQLFTVFHKFSSTRPSPGLGMLFLLFSQYAAIPQYTRAHLLVIYGLIFLSSRKGGDLFFSAVLEAFRKGDSKRCASPSWLCPACWSQPALPSPFPPSFSPIRNRYQLHIDRFMYGWGPASLPLIV